MHTLFFVLTEEKGEGEDALDAQNFSGGYGYYGGGKCDWYNVGGRWTGCLNIGFDEFISEWRTTNPFTDNKCLECGNYSTCLKTKQGIDSCSNEQKLQELWLKHTGKTSTNPITLGTNSINKDDCMELTPDLLAYLIEKYPDTEIYIDIDNEETEIKYLKDSDYFGQYITVIDYHN